MKRISLILTIFLSFIFIWVSYNKINDIKNPIHDFFMKNPDGDKIGHFLMFGGLSFLLNLFLNCKTYNFKILRLYKGSFIIVTLSILDEFSQIYLPKREFEWADMAANILGVMFFYLLTFIFEKITTKKNNWELSTTSKVKG